MKLLIDMFPCQTGSRRRGIGRYSLSLAQEMARLRGDDDMTILANTLYPESFEELRQHFIRLLPSGSFLPYYHYALTKGPAQHFSATSRIAEAFIEHAYQAASADVILTPSLFEGWGGVEHGWVPLPNKGFPNHQRAVILYDLIPYVFRQHYLEPDPQLKAWYMERMEALRNFDMLLAISEATRQDAISILGLDPDRVVNISGAASSHFGPLDLTLAERQAWLHRLGIARPFVLYIGGDDFRKNMEGALRAYARLPRSVSSTHQLVLNDVGDEATFRSKARLLGLADEDLVVFKRRSDEELEALYNLCKVFMFPSLYEGFGLPILEAMACGAPVIAANNSSLPEVVGRADALFDATNDESVADLLHKALSHDAFRSELAEYGPRRAREFSWDRSARLAWAALQRASNDKLQRISLSRPLSGQARLRIAHVSPLPPQKSGVARYAAGLLPYLVKHVDLDLFTQPGLQVSDAALTDNFKIFPWSELPAMRDGYDAVVYHMGNSELHIAMLELLKQIPGVVVSHDFFLSNLPFVQEVRSGKRRRFRQLIDESHGLLGLLDYIDRGADRARWDWPMNWGVLRNAQELIMHSTHQLELLEKFYANGWQPRPTIINTYREPIAVRLGPDRLALRQELKLPENGLLFCSFGFMAETKLNHEVIRAFSQARPRLGREAILVFVGEAEGGEYGGATERLLKELDLDDSVQITGYVTPAQYEDYLSVADVAIQFRSASRGETSSAILDCLAHGLPTVTNAHGSFRDYPDDVVLRLAEQPAPEDLAAAMVRLAQDDRVRTGFGVRAREYATGHHNPEIAAEQYARVIEAAARTTDKALFGVLLDSLSGMTAVEDMVQAASHLAAAHLSFRAQRRILIDVSALDSGDTPDADRQAASDLIRELFAAAETSFHLELVHAPGGRLIRASRLIESILRRPRFTVGPEHPIYFRPGDALVTLDVLLPWAGLPLGLFNDLRLVGGKAVTLVSDFADRLTSPLAIQSDVLICATRLAAEQALAASWKPVDERVVPQDIIYFDSIHVPDFRLLEPSQRAHELQLSPVGADKNATSTWAPRLVQGAGIFAATQEMVASTHAVPHASRALEAPSSAPPALLRSTACSQAALESPIFQEWVGRFKGRRHWMHRKPWEWAYISQALFERGLLAPGVRGLGFAVGTEPLPTLFASYGCNILATDLSVQAAAGRTWIETDQHSSDLMDLWKPEILSEDDFKRLVSFRPVDMNHVDPDLRGFDFVWSSCSLEHLGTLEQGRRFIFESLRCLRPGGVAVHTTEYNLSSNLDTKEEGPDVIYRRRDLEEIAATLKEQGHAIDIDFGLGAGPLDLHVDRQPFKEDAHLRIEIWGYVCTSFGLIIQKGGSPEAPDVLDLDASTPILLSGAVQDRQTPGAAAVLGKVDLIAPLQVQTATEAISAVRCTIASPGGKPLAIVVDQGAADGITTGLIQGNYSFPSHFAMLFDLAPEGGTVLDLGAHVGTFALMAASAGYRVIAVEASARNAALLEESKRQNGFESMRIVNAAAEDRPGTVQFMDAGPWGRVMTGSDGADVTTAAPAVVIDTLVSEMNLADVTLIKMDIEGSEVAAVRGMTGLLSGPMAPPILFESNALTLALRGQTPADLVASLSDFGYSIYQLALGHLVSINSTAVQIPCVADCLAVRRLPPAVQKRWPVISGLTLEQQIHIALPEMTAPNADQRAYVARILQHLDERLLHERRIIEAMHRLQVDPNPQVRLAIEWWHAPS